MCVRCSVLRLFSQHRRAHDLNISALAPRICPRAPATRVCEWWVQLYIHGITIWKWIRYLRIDLNSITYLSDWTPYLCFQMSPKVRLQSALSITVLIGSILIFLHITKTFPPPYGMKKSALYRRCCIWLLCGWSVTEGVEKSAGDYPILPLLWLT